MTDLVSVIIPTYNRANTLERAIISVLNQTYKNIEVIIIDDASTDNTEKIVKSINDKRIVFIKLDSNEGAAAARNLGIKASRGEYIAFQDSDDEWIPSKLTLQMLLLNGAEHDVALVYCKFSRHYDGKVQYPLFPKFIKNTNVLTELLKDNFITTQSVLIKKSCLVDVGGFDDQLPRLQDWELWLRLAKKYKFISLDQILVKTYYQHESITASPIRYMNALDIIAKKHDGLFREYSIYWLARKYYWIGKMLIHSGLKYEGNRCILEAINLCPCSIRFRAYYFFKRRTLIDK